MLTIGNMPLALRVVWEALDEPWQALTCMLTIRNMTLPVVNMVIVQSVELPEGLRRQMRKKTPPWTALAIWPVGGPIPVEVVGGKDRRP